MDGKVDKKLDRKLSGALGLKSCDQSYKVHVEVGYQQHFSVCYWNKLGRMVNTSECSTAIQRDLNKLEKWADKNLKKILHPMG